MADHGQCTGVRLQCSALLSKHPAARRDLFGKIECSGRSHESCGSIAAQASRSCDFLGVARTIRQQIEQPDLDCTHEHLRVAEACDQIEGTRGAVPGNGREYRQARGPFLKGATAQHAVAPHRPAPPPFRWAVGRRSVGKRQNVKHMSN